MMAGFLVETGPASGGWTVYPPLSALPQAMDGSKMGMTLWLISMTFFIVSSLLGGLKLYRYNNESSDKGIIDDSFTTYHLGILY